MANKPMQIRFRSALLALCALAAPALGRAANNCPWLNEATASGLLGGDAVGVFTQAAADQPAVCSFVSEAQGTRRTLRITVQVTPDAHARVVAAAQGCGGDAAPLAAIGNESLACAADDRKGALGERALGRVRDQFFTISISGTQKNDPDLTREALKAKIYTAAEQVSGNLY
jgi:hypothetical protein